VNTVGLDLEGASFLPDRQAPGCGNGRRATRRKHYRDISLSINLSINFTQVTSYWGLAAGCQRGGQWQ
jgi:hypothetical protein